MKPKKVKILYQEISEEKDLSKHFSRRSYRFLL